MLVSLLFVFKIDTRSAFAVSFFYEDDGDRKMFLSNNNKHVELSVLSICNSLAIPSPRITLLCS